MPDHVVLVRPLEEWFAYMNAHADSWGVVFNEPNDGVWVWWRPKVAVLGAPLTEAPKRWTEAKADVHAAFAAAAEAIGERETFWGSRFKKVADRIRKATQG